MLPLITNQFGCLALFCCVYVYMKVAGGASSVVCANALLCYRALSLSLSLFSIGSVFVRLDDSFVSCQLFNVDSSFFFFFFSSFFLFRKKKRNITTFAYSLFSFIALILFHIQWLFLILHAKNNRIPL